jgi:hypothetical protein
VPWKITIGPEDLVVLALKFKRKDVWHKFSGSAVITDLSALQRADLLLTFNCSFFNREEANKCSEGLGFDLSTRNPAVKDNISCHLQRDVVFSVS